MNVYSTSHIYSHGRQIPETEDVHGRGPVVVRQETNDDDDDGYEDREVAVWFLRFADVAGAIRTTGITRRGAYGQPVRVYLDGVPLTKENAPCSASAPCDHPAAMHGPMGCEGLTDELLPCACKAAPHA